MKTNYHTHTTWCDGKNTPEEMALAAIEKGFDALGFSSHSDLLNDPQAYIADIRALAEKFRGRLKIFCGIEAEAGYLPEGTTREDFDYIIAGIHYISAPDGALCPVDMDPQRVRTDLRQHFDGDIQAYILEYFAEERRMVQRGGFDVLAHPDLVRKFRTHGFAFAERAAWFQRELRLTAEEIAKAGVIVEINTGGIARKWLNDAYPSSLFRSLLTRRNVSYILSSDAHSTEHLDCAFERFGTCENFLDAPKKNLL